VDYKSVHLFSDLSTNHTKYTNKANVLCDFSVVYSKLLLHILVTKYSTMTHASFFSANIL